ncbi:hypothetical protein SAMN04489761_2478 [Tenacibaculum sp. MAR_2009_124]|uniref:hypothetical protein n=1 Tax=Tenacibaculum sp. MAR_2009_124 TaxID=1250059 RepID=UPI0008985B19|nr:hypothetical protein [Tenacibaculum sp. MAR_2009_124]SEC24692.1 hypothetical protein SAMN04489761_2478 [Tenacibaculum sp. MAR_2009_124]
MEVCTQKHQYRLSYSKRNAYQLHLGHKTIQLTFCQLLAFRKKILEHTSFNGLETIINEDNFVLIFVADRNHLLLLDVSQLLELNELIQSIFTSSPVI